jgi:hypothetical protein
MNTEKEVKMQEKYMFLIVLLVAGTVSSSLFAAETIITNTGKRFTGELVGFENGYYHLQIGKFVKKVAESQVVQIVDTTAVGATAAPSPAAIAPAQPIPAQPSVAPSSQPSGLTASDSPQAVLDKISATNPALMKYMEMQKSNGVSPDAMMGQIKQMQGNPAMMQMMSKFKDPAFQKTFLANIKKMREAMDPEGKMPQDPNIKLLEGLFGQLNNSTQGAQK